MLCQSTNVLSKACLRSELENKRRDKWLSDNRDAINAWNEIVAHKDVLLSEYRLF